MPHQNTPLLTANGWGKYSPNHWWGESKTKVEEDRRKRQSQPQWLHSHAGMSHDTLLRHNTCLLVNLAVDCLGGVSLPHRGASQREALASWREISKLRDRQWWVCDIIYMYTVGEGAVYCCPYATAIQIQCTCTHCTWCVYVQYNRIIPQFWSSTLLHTCTSLHVHKRKSTLSQPLCNYSTIVY